jgi:hypothetical protein
MAVQLAMWCLNECGVFSAIWLGYVAACAYALWAFGALLGTYV